MAHARNVSFSLQQEMANFKRTYLEDMSKVRAERDKFSAVSYSGNEVKLHL